MADNRELQIILTLKDRATKALKAAGGNFEIAEMASRRMAIGLAAAGTAIAGFGAIAVKAAGESEAKIAQLDATLKSMRLSNEVMATSRDRILEVAAATTKLGFDDETAAISIGRFYQATGDLTKAIQFNAVAMDLSRAKNIELESASRMVMQVMAGNTRALKEFGITLDDTATPLTNIKKLQQVVSGQAENFAGTFAGQMEVFKNAWGDFLEIVGQKLLPVITKMMKAVNAFVINDLPKWVDQTKQLTAWLEKHRVAVILVAAAIAGSLVPALVSLVTVTIPALLTSFASVAIALAPFMIGSAIVAGVVLGIMWIVKNWEMLKEKIITIWSVVSSYMATVWGEMINVMSSAWGKVVIFFQNITSIIIGVWSNFASGLQSIFATVVEFSKLMWETLSSIIQFSVYFIVGSVLEHFEAMGLDIREVFNGIVDFFTETWTSIRTFFSSSASDIRSDWFDLWQYTRDTLSPIWEQIKNSFSMWLINLEVSLSTWIEFVKNSWIITWSLMRDFLTPVWEGIKSTVSSGWNWMITRFNEFKEPLKKTWSSLWEGLTGTVSSAWEVVKNTIKSSINWIIDKVNTVIEAINKVVKTGALFMGGKAPQIGTIPLLADGGIVTKPTLAVVGEAGPEAVIPLRKMNGIGANGIVINVYGDVSGQELIDKVQRGIMDSLRLNMKLA